jgi:hypothetical protein
LITSILPPDSRINDVLTPIALVKVTGLSDVLTKNKESIQETPKVRVQIRITESGIVQVDDAHVILRMDEKKDKASLKDSILKFWGSGKKDDKAKNDGTPDLEDVEDEAPAKV